MFIEIYGGDGGSSPTFGIVQVGDTLTRIASDLYGDTGAALYLASYNEFSVVQELQPGQTIYLPGIIYANDGAIYRHREFIDGGVVAVHDLEIAIIGGAAGPRLAVTVYQWLSGVGGGAQIPSTLTMRASQLQKKFNSNTPSNSVLAAITILQMPYDLLVQLQTNRYRSSGDPVHLPWSERHCIPK